MFLIISTVLWFITIVAIVNWLQISKKCRYGSHWYVHLPVLMVGIGIYVICVPDLLLAYSNPIGLAVMITATLLFLFDEQLRNRHYNPHNYFMGATINPGYRDLLQPPLTSSLVKVGEVLFQNITLLLLIAGMQALFSIWWHIGLVLGAVSFFLHLPSIKTFNWWYGGLFTLLSTIFIFFTPLFVQNISFGIHLIYAFHLLMYPVMMHTSYFLGKKFSKQ